MREIFFRAWDKQKQRMIPHKWMAGILWINRENEHPDWIQYNDGSGMEHLSQFELMQFTGLYDVDIVPIFEGDIVTGGAGESGVIQFRGSKFCGMYMDSQGNIEEPWEDDLNYFSELKVVGNIFELRLGR